MDCKTLFMILWPISGDNDKNNTLKNIISSAAGLGGPDISRILSYYSSDSSKIEAVSIIVSSNKLYDNISEYLPQILLKISSDSSKITILRTLKHYICPISGSTVIKILEYISSDSDKVDIVNIVVPYMIPSNGSFIRRLLSVISSDSSKIDALCIAIRKIGKISDFDAVNSVKYISSDLSKVKCIELIASKMEIDHNNIVDILNNISCDNSKLLAFKIFIRNGFKVNPEEFFWNTKSSNSN